MLQLNLLNNNIIPKSDIKFYGYASKLTDLKKLDDEETSGNFDTELDENTDENKNINDENELRTLCINSNPHFGKV